MDPLQAMVVSAAAAAAAAAIAFLTVRRLAVALAIGYVAGHLAGAGMPRLPPREAWQWLPALALAGAAVGVVESRARWALRFALGLFAAWAVLPKRTVLDVAWLGISLFAWTWLSDRSTRRASAAPALFTLTVVALATSVSLAVSGSMLLAQLGAALTAAAAACLVLAWRSLAPFAAAVPVSAVLLAGLWANGFLYSELPLASALLLAAAPGTAWLAPRCRLVVRLAVLVVASAAAVAFAVVTSPPLEY